MRKFTCLLILIMLFVSLQASTTLQTHNLRTNFGRRSSSKSAGGAGIFGFIMGPILFIMAFPLIWNNEKKAAIDQRRLSLAKGMVEEVNPFVIQQIQDANGKLVHITGDTQTQMEVVDRLAGVSINGVKLEREVEVKEWRARQQGDDNNRRWVYDLMWVSDHQEHAHDRYNPPNRWFIKGETFKVQYANVGSYLLNDSQKDRLQCTQDVPLRLDFAYNIARSTGLQFPSQPQIRGDYIYFASEPGAFEAPGSLRVKFRGCPNGPVSVIAQSKFTSFEPFRIDVIDNEGERDDESSFGGCCCCLMSDCVKACLVPITQIDLICQEKLSYQEMMDKEMKSAKLRACIIRAVAYIMMVAGICLLFSPITTLLGYIPLIGGILKSTVGFLIFVAACIICLPIFLLALSVSWLCFHPKVGIILLLIGIAIAVLIIVLANTVGKGGGGSTQNHLEMMLRHYS